jgi:protoporphyrinogen IX oxidase
MPYTILKFLHVASIAVWFGGVVTLVMLNRLIVGTGDDSLMKGLGRMAGAISMRLFGPAMMVAVIAGIGLVQMGDLSFGSLWIIWGIVGTVLSFVLGGVLTGGTARRLGEQIATGKIDAAGIAATQKKLLMYAVLNILLLLSIIWAMVAKPV